MLLKEVEVSVTASCSLACAHCGFLVPDQPAPYVSDPVGELSDALDVLDRAGVVIGSVAVLGGEATLAKRALTRTLALCATSPVVQRVELVTNGLTPGGLSAEALGHLRRLSLSDYSDDDRLFEAWRAWLAREAPHVELLRRQHGAWDRWSDAVDLGEEGGQRAYDGCWYRRHCVTLERRRVFVCSRIPKLGLDEQGLLLTPSTTRDELRAYLHAPTAPTACRSCTPMAGLERVPPGQQPDERLPRLIGGALRWFEARGVSP